jgi:transposase-like protein
MSSKKLKRPESPVSNKYNRTFSETFKRSKVKEIQAKCLSIREVCELYEVSRTSVYRWIYKYSGCQRGTKMVVQMESEAERTKRLLQQIAELERIVGQKQLEIDYLDKTLQTASSEIGYDIKKSTNRHHRMV